MLLGSRCSFKSALQESQQKRKIMILKDTIRARNKYYVILRRLPICKWENKSINFLTGIVGIRNEHVHKVMDRNSSILIVAEHLLLNHK
ncbi:uncharacterized protein LOC132627594 isoform X9 [Lycium barbarum]|uniref:uncharacterized protein LOC132627594 isoform X9 n=1 Tax=Lycium barbarum TaxID=112863 RepID=UPI00293E4AD0|nr:uncharacterized protein LOC132627594 isoform X9 [Lycium barbarum]